MTSSPLRAVGNPQSEPAASASSGGGGGSNVEQRLARLETRIEYLATKEDVQKLETRVEQVKVWVLAGVIGGMAVAAGLTVAILRLFS